MAPAKTITLPSILLILSVAFTVATIAAANHSPSSFNKTRLVKACSEVLGPGPGGRSLVTFCARDFLGDKPDLLAISSNKTQLVKGCSEVLEPGLGGRSLVTFCARDFLGDKADLLAGCGKQETATIIVNEARKKAKVVEDFKSKIDSDKSLCKKELKDLKSCWESMNAVIKTMEKVYVNVGVKKLSVDVVEENMDKKIAGAMGQCKFSAAERQSGLWAEFHAKADASFNAELVALAFMGEYGSI